jgi:hypothetical protein
MNDRLILRGTYNHSDRAGLTAPTHDPLLSSNARLLWLALRDVASLGLPWLTPGHVLDCDDAEALAVVHELVASGWLAVRWASPNFAIAMVLMWSQADLDAERDVAIRASDA